MKKWLLASAVAAVGMTSAANAAIIVNQAVAVVNPPTANAGTMTGYTGLIISLTNSTGTPITAIDIKNSGGGFAGPLQQRWGTDGDGGFLPSPKGTAVGADSTTSGNLDSHILIPDSDRLDGPGNSPAENNNVSAGAFADTAVVDYGTGSFLTMAAGIVGASAQSTVNLAYIVIKNDASVTLTGIAVADGQQVPFSKVIAVPEPTSLGLLGLGAVGLLARRRRQI